MKYFLSLSERDLFTRDGDFYPDCHLFTTGEIAKLDFNQKTNFVEVEIKRNKTHTDFGVRQPDIDRCIITIIFENKTIVFAGRFCGIIDIIKKLIKANEQKCKLVSFAYVAEGE